MLISCNSCNSKYLVNSAELKPDGRNVQCANCGNQWFQESQVFDDNVREDLTPEVLTKIYGEENWEATIGKFDEDEIDEQ